MLSLVKRKKEAKGKLCATKLKEKSLKQKIQDEVAKAITANYDVPITTKEHDEIVSTIKNKETEAHTEMLECKITGLEEPIFKDNKGHMYWRIKGCSDNPDVLLQDIGTCDHMVAKVDKWFQFDDEQKNLNEGHINLLRKLYIIDLNMDHTVTERLTLGTTSTKLIQVARKFQNAVMMIYR